MAAQPLPTTFVSALWPARTDVSALMRGVLLALLGAALLTLSAKVKAPFYPVPMTMQSMVVLMLGAAYGSRLAVATVLLYLAEGALGLPVFAGTPERGIGLAYMMGPTGGYLLGFVLAAGLVGWLAERGLGRSLAGMALAMTLGHVVLLAAGFAWLAVLFGPGVAWTSGVAAFIPETVVKTALAAILVPAAWQAIDRRAR